MRQGCGACVRACEARGAHALLRACLAWAGGPDGYRLLCGWARGCARAVPGRGGLMNIACCWGGLGARHHSSSLLLLAACVMGMGMGSG